MFVIVNVLSTYPPLMSTLPKFKFVGLTEHVGFSSTPTPVQSTSEQIDAPVFTVHVCVPVDDGSKRTVTVLL